MLIRSVWVVHYKGNSTNGWSCVHCIVSVITRCSVCSACSALAAHVLSVPINYLNPLHYDFINPQLICGLVAFRKSAARVAGAAPRHFD